VLLLDVTPVQLLREIMYVRVESLSESQSSAGSLSKTPPATCSDFSAHCSCSLDEVGFSNMIFSVGMNSTSTQVAAAPPVARDVAAVDVAVATDVAGNSSRVAASIAL